MFDERLLDRVKFCLSGNTFDRCDLAAINLGHRDQTTINDPAVDVHRARATLTLATTILGPRELQLLTQHVEETRNWQLFHAMLPAVNLDRDLAHVHVGPSTSRSLRGRG